MPECDEQAERSAHFIKKRGYSMNNNYTIAEYFTLPSEGKIYSSNVNPQVKLRSMTTADEMQRLGHSDLQYKLMADVIDNCLIDKPGISAYDMCLGDYQYLLQKLRIVTYGNDYNMYAICPHCGATGKSTTDLDAINVHKYTDDLKKYLEFVTPKTGHRIELRVQTPRILDEIDQRKKDLEKKITDTSSDITLRVILEAMIRKVDDRVLTPGELTSFIQTLPMMDTNYILQCITKINRMIGPDMSVDMVCKECGNTYVSPFRVTSQFFGPEID